MGSPWSDTPSPFVPFFTTEPLPYPRLCQVVATNVSHAELVSHESFLVLHSFTLLQATLLGTLF